MFRQFFQQEGDADVAVIVVHIPHDAKDDHGQRQFGDIYSSGHGITEEVAGKHIGCGRQGHENQKNCGDAEKNNVHFPRHAGKMLSERGADLFYAHAFHPGGDGEYATGRPRAKASSRGGGGRSQ